MYLMLQVLGCFSGCYFVAHISKPGFFVWQSISRQFVAMAIMCLLGLYAIALEGK
jgi:hypothetical protein